jgi:ABC-type nitrate/sulfonate/bicarbonate transport system ATPase subunit
MFPAPPILWQLENVWLGRKPDARLRGVTLNLSGGLTAIIGPSGAGKTSLLNLLVRFEAPDAGTLTASLPTVPRLPLFWMPAGGGLWPFGSARRQVTDLAPAQDKAAADFWLRALELEECADRTADQLSRGECERVGVARAMATRASVLVMDEPFAHIPAARRPEFFARVADACRASDTSLIWATHEPALAAMADRIVAMAEGGLA